MVKPEISTWEEAAMFLWNAAAAVITSHYFWLSLGMLLLVAPSIKKIREGKL